MYGVLTIAHLNDNYLGAYRGSRIELPLGSVAETPVPRAMASEWKAVRLNDFTKPVDVVVLCPEVPTQTQVDEAVVELAIHGAVSLRALRLRLQGCTGVDLSSRKADIRRMAVRSMEIWTAGLRWLYPPGDAIPIGCNPFHGTWEPCHDGPAVCKMRGRQLFTEMHDVTSDNLAVRELESVGPHPLRILRATRAVYGDVLNEEVAFNRHGLRRPLGENGNMESVKRHLKQAWQLAGAVHGHVPYRSESVNLCVIATPRGLGRLFKEKGDMEAAELRNRCLQMTSSRLRPFVSAWVRWLPWPVGPLMGLVSCLLP